MKDIPFGLSCFRIPSAIAFTAILACNAPAIRAQAADGILKLNQIQVIGTHNSYQPGIAPKESKILQAKYADAYKGLDYQHQPLPQQFDSGVRQIELDVYADTKGGLYANPSGPSMVAAAKLPPDPDFDPNGVMSKPGFKVMHVQAVDYRSPASLSPLVWSRCGNGPVPIFIMCRSSSWSRRSRVSLAANFT